MNGSSYKVLIDGCVIAERMSLEWALILVKAIFQECSNDPSMKVIVMEHEKTESEGCLCDR